MSDNNREQAIFWEKQARQSSAGEKYYREQLAKSHEILGRVIHQLSERWDSVNLTEWFPTDNLHGRRRVGNPDGDNNSLQ